jgi:hypothetical protein
VRLLLTGGLATEDIRLFGKAPCGAGRRQPQRVCSEGLLGPAANGQCDSNAQDTARIGQASPGQKALVVTCQVSRGGKLPGSRGQHERPARAAARRAMRQPGGEG